ncbi:hypothetical protein DUG83_05375 [Vibrio parahaemolyticus]|nr:hypothetical protein [Vibrio parahaemolyticus]
MFLLKIKINKIEVAFQPGIKAYEHNLIPQQLKHQLIDEYHMNLSSTHGYIKITMHVLNAQTLSTSESFSNMLISMRSHST